MFKDEVEVEDEEEVQRSILWKEDEEIAKTEYFRGLEEEEKNGIKRQSVEEFVKAMSSSEEKEDKKC